MKTHHGRGSEEPMRLRSGGGARSFQLFTLCFTLAVAIACTGEGFNFSTGSSGGTKKKNKNGGKALVVTPGSLDFSSAAELSSGSSSRLLAVPASLENAKHGTRAGRDASGSIQRPQSPDRDDAPATGTSAGEH